VRLFCGIDWAETHHDVALVDEHGVVLARLRIGDDLAGLQRLLTTLAEHGDRAEAMTPVAIETSRGLLVAALRATGRPVYPINPLAAARYRERHAPSRAKSDQADADSRNCCFHFATEVSDTCSAGPPPRPSPHPPAPTTRSGSCLPPGTPEDGSTDLLQDQRSQLTPEPQSLTRDSARHRPRPRRHRHRRQQPGHRHPLPRHPPDPNTNTRASWGGRDYLVNSALLAGRRSRSRERSRRGSGLVRGFP